MSEPTIAEKRPAVIELEAGTYWWCRCGLSKNQPFCDGSHSGSLFEPIEINIAEKKRVALCQCKRSANVPYCDGAHSKL